MMSLWDALRMNMMISYQELVRTFPNPMLSHMSIILKIASPIEMLTNLSANVALVSG